VGLEEVGPTPVKKEAVRKRPTVSLPCLSTSRKKRSGSPIARPETLRARSFSKHSLFLLLQNDVLSLLENIGHTGQYFLFIPNTDSEEGRELPAPQGNQPKG